MTPLENYHRLLQSPAWVEKRKQILERDGHKCRNCQSEVALQVHHRQYHHIGNSGMFYKPWEYPNRYLITLCKVCHEKGHKQYTVPVFSRKQSTL